MNCQYTGIELENKRAKNHPTVTELLNDANRRNVYGPVVEAMKAAKADGITGMEIVEIGRAAMTGGLEAAAQRRAEWRQREEERLQYDSERINFYRQHGYYPGADRDVEGPDDNRAELTAKEIVESRNRTPSEY